MLEQNSVQQAAPLKYSQEKLLKAGMPVNGSSGPQTQSLRSKKADPSERNVLENQQKVGEINSDSSNLSLNKRSSKAERQDIILAEPDAQNS